MSQDGKPLQEQQATVTPSVPALTAGSTPTTAMGLVAEEVAPTGDQHHNAGTHYHSRNSTTPGVEPAEVNGIRDVEAPSSTRSDYVAVHHPRSAFVRGLTAPIVGFRRLPIVHKHVILFCIVQCFLILIIGLQVYFLYHDSREILKEQAASELQLTDITFNIKFDQMSFGFRGQSSNPAFREYAIAPGVNYTYDAVKAILVNEVTTRQMEFASLLSPAAVILVGSNANRTGQVLNPGGIITQAVTKKTQIRVASILSYAEYLAESPPVYREKVDDYSPASTYHPIDTKMPSVIRYTATPIIATNGSGAVVGVLLSGDIVNGKLPIVHNIVNAFQGGFSGVYFYDWRTVGAVPQVITTAFTDESFACLMANVEFAPRRDIMVSVAQGPAGAVVVYRTSVAGSPVTVAVKQYSGLNGTFFVRATLEESSDADLHDSVVINCAFGAATLVVDALAMYLLYVAFIFPMLLLHDKMRRGLFSVGDVVAVTSTDDLTEAEAAQAAQENGGDAKAKDLDRHDEIGKLIFMYKKMVEAIRFHEKVASLRDRMFQVFSMDDAKAKQVAVLSRRKPALEHSRSNLLAVLRRPFVHKILLQDSKIRIRSNIKVVVTNIIAVSMIAVQIWLTYQSTFDAVARQTASEVNIGSITFALKINQMGFGFRGNSDNTAVRTAVDGGASPATLATVVALLKQEITTRKMEYATLVAADTTIIASGNALRVGQSFNPSGVVTEALSQRKQVKLVATITRSEYLSELPPIWQEKLVATVADSSLQPNATRASELLIRWTATPVYGYTAPSGPPLGVLVSGDIVNGKTIMMERILGAVDTGYAGIAYVGSDGVIRTATGIYIAHKGGVVDVDQLSPAGAYQSQILKAMQSGQTVTLRSSHYGGMTYSIKPVKSKTLNNVPAASPTIVVLIRGTKETDASHRLTGHYIFHCVSFAFIVGFQLLTGFYLSLLCYRPLRALAVGLLVKHLGLQTNSDKHPAAVYLRALEEETPYDTKTRDEVAWIVHAFKELSRIVERLGLDAELRADEDDVPLTMHVRVEGAVGEEGGTGDADTDNGQTPLRTAKMTPLNAPGMMSPTTGRPLLSANDGFVAKDSIMNLHF